MPTNTKGVILISVLMIVLILSAISVSIGQGYFLALKREGYINFESNAFQYTRTLEVLSEREIRKQFAPKRSYTSLSMPFFSQPISIQSDYGTITATATDASNCFNINSLFLYENKSFIPNERSIAGLKRLLFLLQYNENHVDSLIDQILDWVDSDNESRANGLEDYFYTGPASQVKQYSSQRLFYHLSELMNLPSMIHFNWRQMKQYLCAHPSIDSSGVNINHLKIKDAPLLASILPDIDIPEAESMILDTPVDGFRTASELYLAFPGIEFNQSYLPIRLNTDLIWVNSIVVYEKSSVSAKTLFQIKNSETIALNRFYNDE